MFKKILMFRELFTQMTIGVCVSSPCTYHDSDEIYTKIYTVDLKQDKESKNES